ncbi:hypothetical protein [Streptomyces sp. NPDC005525]
MSQDGAVLAVVEQLFMTQRAGSHPVKVLAGGGVCSRNRDW